MRQSVNVRSQQDILQLLQVLIPASVNAADGLRNVKELVGRCDSDSMSDCLNGSSKLPDSRQRRDILLIFVRIVSTRKL